MWLVENMGIREGRDTVVVLYEPFRALILLSIDKNGENAKIGDWSLCS